MAENKSAKEILNMVRERFKHLYDPERLKQLHEQAKKKRKK